MPKRYWIRGGSCRQTPFKYIPQEAEGGCGVVGLVGLPSDAADRHILSPLQQMHNRGNGKGGGISAVGLVPEQLGVDKKTLEQDYLVQVAYLNEDVREELEKEFIHATLRRALVATGSPTSDDPVLLGRLEVTPPVVYRYFCRAKKDVLDRFIAGERAPRDRPEARRGRAVYQTSFKINQKYYAGATMSAFVMSHGRNMLIMKIVGYAEDVIHYYKLEDFKAHIWIGHQRYPTKGRVWHPGGAHPFMGLDEALVHNGDFANYYSVTRVPGAEGHQAAVPDRHRGLGAAVRPAQPGLRLSAGIHHSKRWPRPRRGTSTCSRRRSRRSIGPSSRPICTRSPDGPWFFIISRNDHYNDKLQLIGITDTSMLQAAGVRPGRGRDADRPDRLGEAGHRFRPG